ncbi:MAG: M24 family metallopeptidase [Spirochaetaceae bacterium]|jgi:Xaa-Pro aminopeptidase|nr:M24 family metallopeptidase [Spirochaetaceae bacterium]
MVTIKQISPEIILEETEYPFQLPDSIYTQRIKLLEEHMVQTGTEYVIIYGDREHFANIEYFTRYDCRFEEGLFILSVRGEKTIVAGNEGMAYSRYIPFEINRIRFRHFSLQGQPRDGTPALRQIFADTGIGKHSKVGVIGFKYFDKGEVEDPGHTYDLPAYIMEELFRTADEKNTVNFTPHLTSLPDGIRMVIRTPEEAAYIEYQAVKTANVVRRLLKAAKPGMSETELARCAQCDLSPWQMYPLVNFGPLSVSLGLRSPDSQITLSLGDVFGICYSQRGSLCSKVGIAAYDEATIAGHLKGTIENFYQRHWQAVTAWLAALKTGVTGGELYSAVMDIIGGGEFGVTLNPGHYIGMDEWTNSSCSPGSNLPVVSASVLQTDIIAARADPVMTAICEDTVIVADEDFRAALKQAYPGVYARIEKRTEMVRKTLNIPVSGDVLAVSPLTGVMFPYMLNTSLVYALA